MGKSVSLMMAILVLTAFYACWTGAPLIWDGSYQLAITLADSTPFVYLSRFHSWVIWHPTVWASYLTDNLTVLTTIYGLPFTIAPAVGLGVSWWIVRKRQPWLILWAVFGVAAAPLPGQIFIINDSIFQQHLFWPVFLGMLLPLTRAQAVVVFILAIFQLSHPIGMLCLAGTGGATMLMALVERARWKVYLWRTLLMFALAGVSVAKLKIWYDPYAASEASWAMAYFRWRTGVAGWPLRGLWGMWIAGLLAVLAANARPLMQLIAPGAAGVREKARLTALVLGAMAVAAALIGGSIWVFWSSSMHRWTAAVDYRRWLIPLTAPFYLLAFIEIALNVRRREADPAAEDSNLRGWLGVVVTAVFAVVLALQSTQWMLMTRQYIAEAQQRPGPAIPYVKPWTYCTALDHWSKTTLLMLHEGKAPRRLVVPDYGWETMLAERCIPYACFEPTAMDKRPAEPGINGWFDHRELLRRAREDR